VPAVSAVGFPGGEELVELALGIAHCGWDLEAGPSESRRADGDQERFSSPPSSPQVFEALPTSTPRNEPTGSSTGSDGLVRPPRPTV
jgi:hypothetical protein